MGIADQLHATAALVKTQKAYLEADEYKKQGQKYFDHLMVCCEDNAKKGVFEGFVDVPCGWINDSGSINTLDLACAYFLELCKKEGFTKFDCGYDSMWGNKDPYIKTFF